MADTTITMQVAPTEKWKTVKGYEGLYQVNSTGIVKSVHKNIILKAWLNIPNGYYIVSLSKNNQKKCYKIHRLVAEAFIQNPQSCNQVNHKDGNRYNNNVNNLEWVTQSENMKHAFRMGLFKTRKGENNNAHKLTLRQVKKIKTDRAIIKSEKGSLSKLAKKLNVHRSTISRILNNRKWIEV